MSKRSSDQKSMKTKAIPFNKEELTDFISVAHGLIECLCLMQKRIPEGELKGIKELFENTCSCLLAVPHRYLTEEEFVQLSTEYFDRCPDVDAGNHPGSECVQ